MWPAMTKWKDTQYLAQKLDGHSVSIDLTPDGFADSLKNQYLVQPY